MSAIEKINRIGMKELCALVQLQKPGIARETVYRWRQAIKSERGISDANKWLLIEASSNTEAPISWADFYPEQRVTETVA
jgi:hypothetical protein